MTPTIRTWSLLGGVVTLAISVAACGSAEEPDVGADPQVLDTKLVTSAVVDESFVYFAVSRQGTSILRVSASGGPTETVVASACANGTSIAELSVIRGAARWGCSAGGRVSLWSHDTSTGVVQHGELGGSLGASAVLGERWFVSVTPSGSTTPRTTVFEVGKPDPIASFDRRLGSGLVADSRGLFLWGSDGNGGSVFQMGLDGADPREIAHTAGAVEWLRVEGTSWLRVERRDGGRRVVRRSFDAPVDDEVATFDNGAFSVTDSSVYFARGGDEIWRVGLDRSEPRPVFARPRASDGFTIEWIGADGNDLFWSAGETHCADARTGALCCCKSWSSTGVVLHLAQ